MLFSTKPRYFLYMWNVKWIIHLNSKNRYIINKWDKFWRLTFLEELKINWRRCWNFKCVCWELRIINLYQVFSKNTQSCWCLSKEIHKKLNTKHGLSKNILYRTYRWILDRCNNLQNIYYYYYGWRGIKCEWESIEDFIKDMWEWYKPWLQIDRINNDWNYCKENCRWITPKENSRNRRSNIIYEWKCVLDWCTELWINPVTVYSRIRFWWSVERALFTPIKKNNNCLVIEK